MSKSENLWPKIVEALAPIAKRDTQGAIDVYGAFCNVLWVSLDHPAQEYDDAAWGDETTYSCSWRYAGGMVADMRDQGENYLDFYCSGNEGVVTDEIRTTMQTLGLRPVR